MSGGRLARRLALAIGGLGVACLLLAVSVALLRPRTFTTHHDAIGYALSERGVAYRALYFNRQWPDTLTSEFYGTNLRVELAGGRQVPGRLECKVGRTRCAFSIVALGISREPLPELVEAREAEWMVQARALVDELRRRWG